MKLYRVVIVTLFISGLLSPALVLAGALDRGPMQQRYNPAAEEMIRIPGVVGMYEQDALAVLQQAGVDPEIRYDKKYNEDLEGKEGTVIDQDPGAAGVSMLGSIVTITVYWPASMGEEPGSGDYGGQYSDDGGGQWGEPAGTAPPSYQEPAPQWGGGSQPASGAGWTPPPAPAPVPQPAMAPQPVAPTVPVGPTPSVKPRIPFGVVAPAPQAAPGPAVPAKKASVPQTVAPVEPKPAARKKTPIQEQLDTKVPARVDIRNKMKGADRKITPTATQANQQQPAPAPFAATPVQPTATQANQQPAAPAPIVMTPVQQTVTPVNLQPSAGTAAGSLSNQTQSGTCGPGSVLIVDIFKKATSIAKQLGCKVVDSTGWRQCIDFIEGIKKTRLFNLQLNKFWDHLVKNSSLSIGPRDLTIGNTHNGTIVGKTGRMFITPAPIDNDFIKVQVTKKAGKSRTSVTICSYLPGGVQSNEWQFESPKGNKNKGQVWTKNLSNMKGKLLSIHLDGKSTANTFQYNLKASAQ